MQHPSSPTHPLIQPFQTVISGSITSDHCRAWCRHHPATSFCRRLWHWRMAIQIEQFALFCHAKQSVWGLFHLWIWKAQWKLLLWSVPAQNPGWCPMRSTRSHVWNHMKTMCSSYYSLFKKDAPQPPSLSKSANSNSYLRMLCLENALRKGDWIHRLFTWWLLSCRSVCASPQYSCHMLTSTRLHCGGL